MLGIGLGLTDARRPSGLNLDFTPGIVPGFVSFARIPNGTAGYFDSSGIYRTLGTNIPRFPYGTASGLPDGLYVEEAKSYLFTKTEKFDDAIWTKAALQAPLADQGPAPDGNVTADLIREDATAAVAHFMSRAFTATASNTYTFPLFAKAKERDRFGLIFRDTAASANQARVGFNLGTGAIDFAAGAVGTYTAADAGMRSLPNGWWFCWLTATMAADTAVEIRSYMLDAVAAINSPAYDGDGTSSIYWWGFNPIQGSMPVSYLGADAATVARSSDVAKISNLSFLNRAAGTIFVEAVPYGINTVGNNQTLVALSDNTTSNYWHIRIDASGFLRVSGATASGGTPWNSVALGAKIIPFDTQKLAFGWDSTSASVSRNGAAAVGSGGAFAFPGAISQMDIGSLANSFMLNGGVRRIRTLGYRATDAQLQAMTA